MLLNYWLIKKALRRIEHFLLKVGETTSLAHEEDAEKKANERHPTEVPESPVDLHWWIDHKFEAKRQNDKVKVHETGAEARCSVDRHFWNVQPSDATLSHVEGEDEEAKSDECLEVPPLKRTQAAEKERGGHAELADD